MIDLLFLKGPGVEHPYTMRMHDDEIAVGRRWGSSAIRSADIDLSEDQLVSRRHALLRFSEGCWYIEDTGSSNGTQVDMHDIAGTGPVEILPGMLIGTGDTVWTIVPPQWNVIHNDDLVVCFFLLPTIAYAYLHCGIRVLGTVRVGNFGGERSRHARFTIALPEFADALTVDLPPLDSRTTAALPALPLQFHLNTLRRQLEPVQAAYTIKLTGKTTVTGSGGITILGFNAWPYGKAAVKTLAAFIFPRDRGVEKIVFTVKESLLHHEVFSSAEGSPAGDDGVRPEKKTADAIYEYLTRQSQVHYLQPSLFRPSHDDAACYQVLRPPSSIFLFEEPVLKGQGTCLDLALLFAACLERCGILPLVILAGGEPFKPEHAFAGYRTGAMPGPVPVMTDRRFLMRDIERGAAGVLESTGIAEGYAASGKLTIDQAHAEAARILREAAWVCILDVGALRPPEGSITPMGYPYDPDVVRIYDAAEKFTREKKRRGIESRFLLYGILAARGPVLQTLSDMFEPQFSAVMEDMEKNISGKEYTGPLFPTITYSECLQLAEKYAWQSGCQTVREQDVLWAVIEKGRANIGIRRICQQAELDLSSLAAALEDLHPRPPLFGSTNFSDY